MGEWDPVLYALLPPPAQPTPTACLPRSVHQASNSTIQQTSLREEWGFHQDPGPGLLSQWQQEAQGTSSTWLQGPTALLVAKVTTSFCFSYVWYPLRTSCTPGMI